MNNSLQKHKTLLIIVTAILIAGIGFGAGMIARTSMAAGDPSDYIGADRAKQIALENIGVSQQKATFTQVEVDTQDDNQGPHYDVDLYTASAEYEFEIDALSGAILHKENQDLIAPEDRLSAQSQKNVQNEGTAQQKANTTPTVDANHNVTEIPAQNEPVVSGNNPNYSAAHDYIGVSRAKEIALQHAGIPAADATIMDAKLDSDDGIRLYEIEFIAAGTEYDYEVDAVSGAIIGFESESLAYDD